MAGYTMYSISVPMAKKHLNISRSAAEFGTEFHILVAGGRWNEPALIPAFNQGLRRDRIC